MTIAKDIIEANDGEIPLSHDDFYRVVKKMGDPTAQAPDLKAVDFKESLCPRVGHGNGKEKATARANQFACLFRVAGNRKQQISSLAATLFFAGNEIGFYRQRKSLPATKLVFIGNKQVCRKPKAIRRQQKKTTLPATKAQNFRHNPNNFGILTLAG